MTEEHDGFWDTIDALRNSGLQILEQHIPIYRLIYESGFAFGRENLLAGEPDAPWRRSVRKNAKEYRKRRPSFRDIYTAGGWVSGH